MFAYKDKRFGCLSRAAAVLLFLLEHISNFLSENPHIVNKLACLTRELLELPYLKTVFLVFNTLGVHLIEPFYAKTIENGATYSSLKVFYQKLYDGLSSPVDMKIFQFTEPAFGAVSSSLFEGVKHSYGSKIISTLSVLQINVEMRV